jgi:uncharacterized membrane protein
MVPLHPAVVHFPIAVTFLLPVLIVVFAMMIRANKMTPKGWLIIVGLQLAVVISGYVSLETGETEEHKVEKVISKSLIHEHEEAAEIFVGSTVIALVLSIAAFFIRKEIGFKLKLGIAVLTLISCYLAYRTGELGGELIYKHGGASAYGDETSGLLPTPGLNTSESSTPENESLKPDDNDYGNADEEPTEEVKDED